MFSRSSGKIDLPSMPATLARIIQITNRPEATAEQVAKIVMLDQSLATKVLRLANSAYFGRRTKAQTVTEAVVTLGFTSIRNLAASASVVDALFPKRLFHGFSWQDMWTHSVMCGLAAEALHARMVGRGGANESAFLAGLLHDVGKLVLARALPQKFVQIVDACREYGYEMVRAESNFLSTNHGKVGAELAQQWEFPSELHAGIAFHHCPDDAMEYDDVARAVHAADLLAKRMGRSYLEGVKFDIGLKDIAESAGLDLRDMDMVANHVRGGLEQCREILEWGNKMPGADTALAA